MFKLAKWAIVVAETININDVESISSTRDWQSRISCAAKMVKNRASFAQKNACFYFDETPPIFTAKL